jgi:hypothetical protein
MTRSAMDRLAAAKPADLGAEPDARRREHDLDAIMSQPFRPRHRMRTPATRRVTIGVAATAAMAATAALVVATGDTGGHVRTRDGRAPVTLDARALLLTAADQAYRQPSGAGAYWHMVTLDRQYLRVGSGGAGYTLMSQTRSESWTPSGAGKDQWNQVQPLGAVPATPADRAVWRRVGAPEMVRVRVPIAPGSAVTKPMVVSMRAGKVFANHQPLVVGDMAYWLGRNVTMKDIQALPATPSAFRSYLLRSYTGHDTEAVGRPMSQDAYLFQVTSGLITQAPISAKVRAAAFRMLADLPSVMALGSRTDAQGRSGVALTLPMPDAVSGHQLIIDPGSGRALADETVVVHPSGSAAAYQAGSPLASSTVLTEDWTDTTPATH